MAACATNECLEHNSPQVHQDFLAAGHVVRRTVVHTWEGVSPDDITEQTLIRSLNSTGGLTRGKIF